MPNEQKYTRGVASAAQSVVSSSPGMTTTFDSFATRFIAERCEMLWRREPFQPEVELLHRVVAPKETATHLVTVIHIRDDGNGTANTLNPPTTQIGLFAAATRAINITVEGPLPLLTNTSNSPAHFKMAFEGCAVTNGMLGLLFASGLRQQAKWVKQRVDQILDVYGAPVKVNVLGLSRGGIAGIFLGQSFEAFERSQLFLFDPVPGDQTWSGFPYTGAFAKDLSNCLCLRRVLAIYPYEPLPDITFHAPLLVAYPAEGCHVEEDVTLGCHQGALFATKRSNHSVHRASNLSFRRIVNFFNEVGTYFSYQPSDADCLEICRAALLREAPSKRKLHDGLGRNRSIVRRNCGIYLNKYHESIEPTKQKTSLKGFFAEQRPKFMLDFDFPESSRACFWIH